MKCNTKLKQSIWVELLLINAKNDHLKNSVIRAMLHGWPNTYVFTKAMGEMLLADFKEKANLIILRPTIITSTYREPFPGWIEGLRYLF